MDEDVEAEIGACFPERTQRLGIECLALQLGRDDHTRKAKLDGTASELGRSRPRIERRNMREPDEAAGVIALGLPHPVIDQAAGSEIRLIEASPEDSTARSIPAWSIMRTCAERSA